MYLFNISTITGNVLKRALFPQFDRAKDTNKENARKVKAQLQDKTLSVQIQNPERSKMKP